MSSGGGIDTSRDQHDEQSLSLLTNVWRITWTRAFPTLLPTLLYTDRHELVWQLLAARVLSDDYDGDGAFTNGSNSSLADADGIEGVHRARNGALLSSWRGSLGYGEISDGSILTILSELRKITEGADDDIHSAASEATVVDLDCGSGRVLLTAALAWDLSRVVGIEIVPSLFDQALHRYGHWQSWHMDLTGTTLSSSRPLFVWKNADFTKEMGWTQQAHVVIIHATVFENDLLVRLNELCRTCQMGTYFCLISNPLTTADGMIETIQEFTIELTWGQGCVYLQRKVR